MYKALWDIKASLAGKDSRLFREGAKSMMVISRHLSMLT